MLLEPNFAPGLQEPLWQCWATPGQIFAAWHLGITCHELCDTWHLVNHLNINTEPGHDQSHTSEVTWDDKCLSLSVNIGPWDWVLNTLRWGQWRWLVEIRSGSWQHWHHDCLLKVYNTNKMWRWWGLVALGDGVTKVSWVTLRHFLWSLHDHNCHHSRVWAVILSSDWLPHCRLSNQMSGSGKCHCWGEMSERETDGHKMFHQPAYCSAQPNQLSGINPHQEPEKFLTLFLFWNFYCWDGRGSFRKIARLLGVIMNGNCEENLLSRDKREDENVKILSWCYKFELLVHLKRVIIWVRHKSPDQFGHGTTNKSCEISNKFILS